MCDGVAERDVLIMHDHADGRARRRKNAHYNCYASCALKNIEIHGVLPLSYCAKCKQVVEPAPSAATVLTSAVGLKL